MRLSSVARLLQAVVVALARHMIQRVPEEMNITPLPGRLRQNLRDRLAEAGMIVGDHELHTVEAEKLCPHSASVIAFTLYDTSLEEDGIELSTVVVDREPVDECEVAVVIFG